LSTFSPRWFGFVLFVSMLVMLFFPFRVPFLLRGSRYWVLKVRMPTKRGGRVRSVVVAIITAVDQLANRVISHQSTSSSLTTLFVSRSVSLQEVGRFFMAPWLRVHFADFFIGDILASCVVALYDLEFSFCYIFYDVWTQGNQCIATAPTGNVKCTQIDGLLLEVDCVPPKMNHMFRRLTHITNSAAVFGWCSVFVPFSAMLSALS
jgi:hypothetical protein